jgi:hypothetical protein
VVRDPEIDDGSACDNDGGAARRHNYSTAADGWIDPEVGSVWRTGVDGEWDVCGGEYVCVLE